MEEEAAPQAPEETEHENTPQEETGTTVTFHGHGYILGVPGTFAGEHVMLSADGSRVLARAPLTQAEVDTGLPPEEISDISAEGVPIKDTQGTSQSTPEPVALPGVAEVPQPERRRPGRVRTTAEAPEQPPEGPAA